MDFKELLSVADYNKAEAKSEASVKRYSSVLPPPKKPPKSNVQSDNVKRFLEKKKAEAEAKANEARKLKEQLLALRAQNTKSNKKAKIMASRTKDNDFSKIKLTEDEIQSQKKVAEALMRKNLADKVERMKARIEMEEREKLLPKKRKRKSKNPEHADDHIQQDDQYLDEPITNNMKYSEQNSLDKKNGAFKKPRPPPPALSFSELLKVAEKKQFEPVEIRVKKKEEERLMTKKERRLMEQEQERLRRKQERKNDSANFTKPVNSSHTVTKKNIPEKITEPKVTKKPVVIHVEKDSRPAQESSKFKIPRNNCDLEKRTQNAKILPDKTVNNRVKPESSKLNPNILGKDPKLRTTKDPKKVLKPIKDENNSSRTVEEKKKVLVQKKNAKISPVTTTPSKQNVPSPSIDEDAIAAIERRIREKIEKEMEAKLAAKFGLTLHDSNSDSVEKKVVNAKNSEKVKSQTDLNKTHTPSVAQKVVKPINNQSLVPKKDLGNAKKEFLSQKPVARKPPPIEKKAFHKNPYLDPPRRLLEPQRPPRPVPKRRIESDDEDDDDMSDFIDDGPSQNDEDYSKYIKEIFGYDRNKYVDCDDEEVLESSFSEQMNEEIRSARLGYLEDLEEERLEMARKKKKKLKK